MGEFLTNEDIKQRKDKGINMKRLDCGWNIANQDLAEIITFIKGFVPRTDVERRNKKILEYAFIKNMNASQIKRLNDPAIIGHGNRSKGKPLSVTSILKICYKYVPKEKIRKPSPVQVKKQRMDLWRKRQQGEINRPRLCSVCGNTANIELHHIIPINIGGTNDYYNLINLCHDCHQAVHRNILKYLK